MGATKVILAINAGSSSLKTTLFRCDEERLVALASAQVSGLTDPPAKLKYCCGSQQRSRELPSIKCHSDAFQHIVNAYIADEDVREVAGSDNISYACHRVVHGGEYTKNQLITDETYHKIEELEDLAPL
jgi:acetate kinase